MRNRTSSFENCLKIHTDHIGIMKISTKNHMKKINICERRKSKTWYDNSDAEWEIHDKHSNHEIMYKLILSPLWSYEHDQTKEMGS